MNSRSRPVIVSRDELPVFPVEADPPPAHDIHRLPEHGFGKPEERAYTHAIEVLGVGPDETWMVGDNLEWEIVAPQRLGIYAIWHDGYVTMFG